MLHGLAWLYGRSGLAGRIPPIANVVVSNVPGPQVPLYAAGARMATYWPLSITEHGVGLNLTVMSYAGAMGFGFTTARNAVPDAHGFRQRWRRPSTNWWQVAPAPRHRHRRKARP